MRGGMASLAFGSGHMECMVLMYVFKHTPQEPYSKLRTARTNIDFGLTLE